MGKLPMVFIITWCQDRDRLYGSTLVFSTLRIGFAQIAKRARVTRPSQEGICSAPLQL
ncbi:MAG: hypothetical protein JWO81_2800 [Alphaproteobacteria bacterium]|nr:hypothetical protein [Alphaproteobacteria bacterium]